MFREVINLVINLNTLKLFNPYIYIYIFMKLK